MEGNYRGLAEILPAPFNVVLEDDTYKGEMTVGMKFIPNVSFCISVFMHKRLSPDDAEYLFSVDSARSL